MDENTTRKRKGGARTKAREWALQHIYAWLINPDTVNTKFRAEMQIEMVDRKINIDFANYLIDGAVQHSVMLEQLFQPFLDRPMNELAPLEKALLLLAAFELRDAVETPYRVVMNEAIELAKRYGGTDGHKYINGVLDKLIPVLRPHEIQAIPLSTRRADAF